MEVLLLFLAQRLLQFATAGEYGVYLGANSEIREELKMNLFEYGLLSTYSFVGIAISTLVAGWLFSRVSTQHVLRGALLITVAGCATCITAPTKIVLSIGRFVSGCGHGPTYVFYPVWVDRHAPNGWETTLLGIVNVVNAVGSVSFFGLTTVVMSEHWGSWRTSLLVCIVMEGVVFLGTLLLPSSSQLFTPVSPREHAVFLCSPTIALLCLALACQCFTLTAVEYFGTSMLIEEYGVSSEYANKLYLCAAIGPLIGAVLGSLITDAFGGYRVRKTGLLLCIAYSSLGLPVFAWLWAPNSAERAVAALGIAMFLQACIFPVLQGLLITTVPGKEMEASAVMNFVCTAFGYMLGPAVSGWIAEGGAIHSWRTAISLNQLVLVFLVAVYFCETEGKPEVDENTPLLLKPCDNNHESEGHTGEL